MPIIKVNWMLFTQILIFLDGIMMMMMCGLSDCLGWSLWSSCGSRSWFPKLSLFGLVNAAGGGCRNWFPVSICFQEQWRLMHPEPAFVGARVLWSSCTGSIIGDGCSFLNVEDHNPCAFPEADKSHDDTVWRCFVPVLKLWGCKPLCPVAWTQKYLFSQAAEQWSQALS